MNKNSETLLNDLYLTYQNLAEIVKNENDPKKLKLYETEMNKINNLTRSLSSYINFYKLKQIKK
jgi:hypothetical protein